jgi:hypothetical protein
LAQITFRFSGGDEMPIAVVAKSCVHEKRLRRELTAAHRKCLDENGLHVRFFK